MHLIKRILIVTLTFAVLLSGASKTLLLLDFFVNRDYIANNICEKKETKDNCCRGYCHLTKQMKQDEKREPSNTINDLKTEIASTTLALIDLKFYFFFIQRLNHLEMISLSIGFLNREYQPPRV
jgi:hypothetical protein